MAWRQQRWLWRMAAFLLKSRLTGASMRVGTVTTSCLYREHWHASHVSVCFASTHGAMCASKTLSEFAVG